MIQYQYFPKFRKLNDKLSEVIMKFIGKAEDIDSAKGLDSDKVLGLLANDLENMGFLVQRGTRKEDKVTLPVTYGINGVPDRVVNVDAYNEKERIILEIEGPDAVTSNVFLKDLLETCMMDGIAECVIAVGNRGGGADDFRTVTDFMRALFACRKITLPIDGVLIIGY